MKKKHHLLTTIWTITLLGIVIFTGYELYLSVNTIDYQKYSNLLGMNSDGSLITDYSNLEDSGLTGEEYSFNADFYPYYSKLSQEEKTLYKQIYANFSNLETTFVPIIETNKKSIDTVIESVLDDHPEIFWMGDSYSYKYTKDGICRQVILEFNNLVNNYQNNKNKIEEAVNRIIVGTKAYNTNYEKELYVHNELIKKISYDSNSAYNQTIYSALVNNNTVCAGYAKAFQYILTKLGIPTYYVTGVSEGEDHAWNIIYLEGFYNVDLTWDDASTNQYQFFNLTDINFNSTHQRGVLSSNLPTCNSTKYSYKNQSIKSIPKQTQTTIINTKEQDENKPNNEQKYEPSTIEIIPINPNIEKEETIDEDKIDIEEETNIDNQNTTTKDDDREKIEEYNERDFS